MQAQDDYGQSFRHVHVADGQMAWVADFHNFGSGDDEQALVDIELGTNGGAWTTDADGDGTVIGWKVPNPRFNGHLGSGVDGWDWTPNEQIEIAAPGGPFYTTSDDQGNFNTWDMGDFPALQPGDEVQVTDGSKTKTLTLLQLDVTGFDTSVDSELVTGTATPDETVFVEISDTPDQWIVRYDRNGSGSWSAELRRAGHSARGAVHWDLDKGANGAARIEDEDGDSTQRDWHIPNPAFNVHPLNDSVDGWDWQPGATITVSVNDVPSTPSRPTITATSRPRARWVTSAFGTIQVSDGTTTKETVVQDFEVFPVDIANEHRLRHGRRRRPDPGPGLEHQCMARPGRDGRSLERQLCGAR